MIPKIIKIPTAVLNKVIVVRVGIGVEIRVNITACFTLGNIISNGHSTANSPTLAEPCCADSTDSQTLAKGHFREKCDSPRQIRTSNARVSIPYNIIYLFLFQFLQVIDHLLHCWLYYWQQHLPYVVVVVQVMFPFFWLVQFKLKVKK